MGGQSADERDRVLAWWLSWPAVTWQRQINLIDRAAFQRNVRCAAALSRSTLTMTSSSSVRSSSFRSRGVVVAACQTWPDRLRARADGTLIEGERPGRASSRRESSALAASSALSAPPIRARGRERPGGCQDRRHGSGARAARFVARPLDAETPLPERGLAIGFEPLRSGDSGGELCRLEGGDEGPCDGLVDLDAADVEAIDAAALDQDLAGAMISGAELRPR